MFLCLVGVISMSKKIIKGDFVSVISGDHVGSSGTVIKVYNSTKNKISFSQCLISGVNVRKKRLRDGSVSLKEFPLHISNVMLVDKDSGGRSRVGFKVSDSGKKVRFFKLSGKVLDV